MFVAPLPVDKRLSNRAYVNGFRIGKIHVIQNLS